MPPKEEKHYTELTKEEFAYHKAVALWYAKESERCYNEGNRIGCLFWGIMADRTAVELGYSGL